jgi:hypothetical protein
MTPARARRYAAPALAALAALALAAPVSADNTNSKAATLLSGLAAGGQSSRLEYELEASAWVFILPVTGKAGFEVKFNPDKTYEIGSRVKTTGLADVLIDYDMRIGASGYVTPAGLKTFNYVSQNNDGKKNRRVEMTYGATDVTMVATPAFGNLGDPVAQPAQKLDAVDPITALINFSMQPRSGTPEQLCGGPMKLFDGRQLTHFHFSYHGKKKVKSKAWSGEAIECHVTMDKVAGYKPGEANRDTLTGIEGPLRMWLAPLPNGTYVPVRIQADTDKIGKVVLQASKLKFTTG